MSIQVQDLRFAYDSRPVLDGVTFDARAGELLAVLGPNGVGKSTLFKCLLGLLDGYTGSARIGGEEARTLGARALAGRIAYIPQSHYPSFNFSVLDMVLMGTTARLSAVSGPGRRETERAKQVLEELGIGHLMRRGFMQISGGERQLTLIARALAQDTRILLMDEPCSSLDYGNQVRVMEEVKRLAAAGYCIVETTHDPNQAYLCADSLLALKGGRVVAHGPPQQVLDEELINDLYGVEVTMHSVCSDRLRVCVPYWALEEEAERGLPRAQ